MSLKNQLMDDMKSAMRQKEEGKVKLAVIRMVRAAIKQTEIDSKTELEDNDIMALIAKEVKMRRESIEEFKKGNRDDLVAKNEEEIEILLTYLPKQLTEAEVENIVKEAIEEIGATSQKDMGKVMALIMPKVKGRADGKMVNTIVKNLLG